MGFIYVFIAFECIAPLQYLYEIKIVSYDCKHFIYHESLFNYLGVKIHKKYFNAFNE